MVFSTITGKMSISEDVDLEDLISRPDKLRYDFFGTFARRYKNEKLPKLDDFRRRAVDAVYIVQSVHPMACWIAKGLNCVGAKIQVSPRTYAFATIWVLKKVPILYKYGYQDFAWA